MVVHQKDFFFFFEKTSFQQKPLNAQDMLVHNMIYSKSVMYPKCNPRINSLVGMNCMPLFINI